MDCREAEQLVDQRLDGEVETPESALLESHLERCLTCRVALLAKGACLAHIRAKLREEPSAPIAPDTLRQRIIGQNRECQRGNGLPWGRLIPATLGVSVLAVLSWSWSGERSLVSEDTVTRHSVNLPPELRADDDLRVEHFFQKNLPYHVAVPKFRARNPDVHLVGARLSNLDDHEAAYMMYDQRGARLSVFAYPRPLRAVAPADFEEVRAGRRVLFVGQRRGYHVVAWEEGGVVYSLVSDLDPRELVDLAAAGD